jgi:hypothetical protein
MSSLGPDPQQPEDGYRKGSLDRLFGGGRR